MPNFQGKIHLSTNAVKYTRESVGTIILNVKLTDLFKITLNEVFKIIKVTIT